jgi:hypothetical protein
MIIAPLLRSLGIRIPSLTKVSASSPVTSDTVTVRGNGTIEWDTVTSDGGTPQYDHNSGGWTNITEGGTLAVAGGDTLAVRATLGTVGFRAEFDILNNTTGDLIQSVTLERS